eukprot:jgi/Mesvir1/19202/Mv11517-RA.1
MALSHSWDEDRGEWVPRELVQGKVAFPTWPTYYRLKALEEEMAKAAGVEQSEDGTFVSASLEVGVLEAIAHIEKVCDVQLDLAVRVVPLTRVVGGGDKHYVNAERGQSTCAHTFPCNKCLCPKAKFGYLEESKAYPLRTAALACQLAHVWDVEKQGPFKCKGCNVTFTTQAQLAKTKPSPTKAAAHALDHYGQRWGCTPILPIEHADHPDCILHLLLNVVCSLVDHTLLANLLKSQEEEMLKTLHEECGVYIKAKHVKATSKSGNARAPEKPTIIGREALSLLEKFDVCVDKLGDGLPPGKGDHISLIAWESTRSLWVTLSDPDFQDDGPGGANRAHKASEVQEQAEIFFNAFLQVATPEAVTTYMHDLVCHIPSQVLAFGDLRLYSQEGLEHMHHMRKEDTKRCTNHRSKLGRDAKGKGMGVSMLTQGMKSDKVRQKLCREVPLPPSDTEMRARKRINAMPPVE